MLDKKTKYLTSIKKYPLPSDFRENYLTQRESKQNKRKKELISLAVQRKTDCIPANSSTLVDMTRDITVGHKRNSQGQQKYARIQRNIQVPQRTP